MSAARSLQSYDDAIRDLHTRAAAYGMPAERANLLGARLARAMTTVDADVREVLQLRVAIDLEAARVLAPAA